MAARRAPRHPRRRPMGGGRRLPTWPRPGRRGGVNAGHGQAAAPERRGGGGERPPHRRRPRREVTACGAGREPEPPEPSDAGTQRRKGRRGPAQSPAAGHTRPVTRTRPVTFLSDAVTATGNRPDTGLSPPRAPQHASSSPIPSPAAGTSPPAAPAPAAPPGGRNGRPGAPARYRTGGARGGYESAKRGRPLPAPPRLLRPGGPRGPHRRPGALTEPPGGPDRATGRPRRGAARGRCPPAGTERTGPGSLPRDAAPRDATGIERGAPRSRKPEREEPTQLPFPEGRQSPD
ncbi:translation initiation factor IF-2-like [Manacus candei]|uniref:translation initiation factor IF-2-like n=1 Tax=Manacus candei TaxID=415023 RepID=UPI0022264ED3|nr:translation initiation factor IF-2-like [Manacus candei]